MTPGTDDQAPGATREATGNPGPRPLRLEPLASSERPPSVIDVLRLVSRPAGPRRSQYRGQLPAARGRRAAAQPAEPVDGVRYLDPRGWLLWLAAVTVPALLGRNPFLLAALLVVALTVRAAWAGAVSRGTSWTLILRLALVAAAISVALNVLAAPYGDVVILHLPAWWPLGDVMTLNALLFGLASALAVVTIVVAGTVVGSLTDWPALLRLVPGRLLPLAVAGSVAWAFVPQTVATARDIADAQRARGIPLRSARALVPLLVPLLATSLDRATTMAEALEARGFGGHRRATRRPSRAAIAAGVGAATLATCLALAWREGVVAGPAAVTGTLVAVAVMVAIARRHRSPSTTTRYRSRPWRGRDTWVAGSAVASLALTAVTWVRDRDAITWSPYPDLVAPASDGVAFLAAAILLVPAVVAPPAAQAVSASRDALAQGPVVVRSRAAVEAANRHGRGPGKVLHSPARTPLGHSGAGVAPGLLPSRRRMLPQAGVRWTQRAMAPRSAGSVRPLVRSVTARRGTQPTRPRSRELRPWASWPPRRVERGCPPAARIIRA